MFYILPKMICFSLAWCSAYWSRCEKWVTFSDHTLKFILTVMIRVYGQDAYVVVFWNVSVYLKYLLKENEPVYFLLVNEVDCQCIVYRIVYFLLIWTFFISSTARLVLALGAEAKLDVVPGATEFAIPFSTLEDARVSAMKDGSII